MRENQIKELGNYHFVGKTLGKGHFGFVELAVHALTNIKVDYSLATSMSFVLMYTFLDSFLLEGSILLSINLGMSKLFSSFNIVLKSLYCTKNSAQFRREVKISLVVINNKSLFMKDIILNIV